jgi:hypothetical protein
MIVTYFNILAALMLLAQPASSVRAAGLINDGVTWSADAPPTAALISAGISMPMRPSAAKPLGLHLLPKPRPKTANLQPAGTLDGHTRDTPRVMVATTPVAQRTAALTVPVTDGDTAKTGPEPSKNIDRLVAIVLARPEIRSVSDLASKTVAIDDADAAASGEVRTAMVAAGAASVQLSGGHAKAIDRMINGELPAVVLTLEAPEAAQTFPEIPGFRMFRVPLSPASLNGPPNSP